MGHGESLEIEDGFLSVRSRYVLISSFPTMFCSATGD